MTAAADQRAGWLAQLRRGSEESVGIDFLPPGWQAIVREVPALIAEVEALQAALGAVITRHHGLVDSSRDWSECPPCGRACAALEAWKAREVVAK